MSWWALAFQPMAIPVIIGQESNESLALKTSLLLEELSPLHRDTLHQALAGDYALIIQLIDQWDNDAKKLHARGVKGIQRLSDESLLQAHLLSHFILTSDQKTIRRQNCKLNLDLIRDDCGNSISISDHFKKYLPQTYLSASILLSIAPAEEIIALPRGLRGLTKIYSTELLNTIPEDIGAMNSERLYSKKPDLAFVAPYSHPPSLAVLNHQKIPLFSINYLDSVEDIKNTLLKVGHASNHILEAQLLALFMDACFFNIDNRLTFLNEKFRPGPIKKKFLYLSYRQHYEQPTQKSLTGQLMARAISFCPHLDGTIPEREDLWRIPFEQERLIQSSPDVMIISTMHPLVDQNLKETQAFNTQSIYCVDEVIQDSPTHYLALAYFDFFQALSATYL